MQPFLSCMIRVDVSKGEKGHTLAGVPRKERIVSPYPTGLRRLVHLGFVNQSRGGAFRQPSRRIDVHALKQS